VYDEERPAGLQDADIEMRIAEAEADAGPCLVCGEYDGAHDPECVSATEADRTACPECGSPTFVGSRGRRCSNFGGCENAPN
jgi:hypothetical protein